MMKQRKCGTTRAGACYAYWIILCIKNNNMHTQTHRHTQNKIKNFQSAGSDPCVCCEREQRSEWRQQQQHSSSGTIATAITFAKYIKWRYMCVLDSMSHKRKRSHENRFGVREAEKANSGEKKNATRENNFQQQNMRSKWEKNECEQNECEQNPLTTFSNWIDFYPIYGCNVSISLSSLVQAIQAMLPKHIFSSRLFYYLPSHHWIGKHF